MKIFGVFLLINFSLDLANIRVAGWPDTCPQPDCNNPENRGLLFPSLVMRQYYQCDPDGNGGWIVSTIDCPCDSLFSFYNQRCMAPYEFVPHCRFDISNPEFEECPTTVPPTTTTSLPPGFPNAPDTCPAPDCNVISNRGFLFPSKHLRFYYFCSPVSGGTWMFQIGECPCGHLFNFLTQKCEFPWAITPHCRADLGGDTSVVPC